MVLAIIQRRPGAGCGFWCHIPISQACSVYFSLRACFSLCGAMTPTTMSVLPGSVYGCPLVACPWKVLAPVTQGKRAGKKGEGMRIRGRDFYKAPPLPMQTHTPLWGSWHASGVCRGNRFHPESDPLRSFSCGNSYRQTAQETWHSGLFMAEKAPRSSKGLKDKICSCKFSLWGWFLLCIYPPPTPSCSFTVSHSSGLNGKGQSSFFSGKGQSSSMCEMHYESHFW